MITTKKPSMLKYGISCLATIVAMFSVIFLLTKYYLIIFDFIGMVVSHAFNYMADFFSFTLPASPSITAVCIGVSLWLVCMIGKLEECEMLSLKFNSQCIKVNYIAILISISFFSNLIIQSTSGYTALKTVLTIGLVFQLLTIVYFSGTRDELKKPKKKTLPLDF